MKTFIIFLLLFLYSNICFSKSLFDTKFYEINFISDDVETDKLKKINQIKIESINLILKDILIIKDYDIIKRELNADLINTFIKNIIIEDEKIINNNYFSKIKINYNKLKIIKYLRKNKIGYVEYLPKNFLIIILEENNISKNFLSKNYSHFNFLINNSLEYKIKY